MAVRLLACVLLGFLLFIALTAWWMPRHCVAELASPYAVNVEQIEPVQTDSKEKRAAEKKQSSKTSPRRVFQAQIEKQHTNEDHRSWWNKFLCDFKIGDFAIGFFTYCLVVVGYFTMQSADVNTKRKERAYVICAGLHGIPMKGWRRTWEIEKRAEASMFKGPWRMALHNLGQTPGFTVKVEWGICPKGKYPKNWCGKHVRVSAVLSWWRFWHRGFRNRYMKHPSGGVTDVQDIFNPSMSPIQYRHVVIPDELRKPESVFFGRIKYKDVFRDRHYSTWALRITEDGEHTDGIADAYSDDHD